MDNTKSYMAHRLRVAGREGGTIFSDEACRAIYKYSRGAPRSINRLAKLSMEYAHTITEGVIRKETVEVIQSDIILQNSAGGDK
jgi:general secretion pathway protein A